MQTHEDNSHRSANDLIESLQRRAEDMVQTRKSEITAGKPDEQELASWKHGDMCVRHLPDDEDGVLRISVGGSPHPVLPMNYLVFRGSVGECESLLRKALTAITKYK